MNHGCKECGEPQTYKGYCDYCAGWYSGYSQGQHKSIVLIAHALNVHPDEINKLIEQSEEE